MKKSSIILALFAISSVAVAVAQPQYKVEKLTNGVEVTHVFQGSGKTPSPTSKVTVNYEGKLQNGTVFDSSYTRGKPISFRLDQVIECWTEGVQKMQVGGKAFLKCPSETAYGKKGAGDVVPPNATLTFQVELLDTN